MLMKIQEIDLDLVNTLWTLQCTHRYSNKIIRSSLKKIKKIYFSEIIKRFENLTGYKKKKFNF
jgi:hypothetical protein